MAQSVLFRIDGNGNIEVADDGPAPDVIVDADGQLHAETGIITHAGEDPRRGTVALAVVTCPVRSTTDSNPLPPLSGTDTTRQFTPTRPPLPDRSLLFSPPPTTRMNGAVPHHPQKTHVGSRSTSRINSSMCGVGRARSYTWNLRFRSRHSSDHSFRVFV